MIISIENPWVLYIVELNRILNGAQNIHNLNWSWNLKSANSMKISLFFLCFLLILAMQKRHCLNATHNSYCVHDNVCEREFECENGTIVGCTFTAAVAAIFQTMYHFTIKNHLLHFGEIIFGAATATTAAEAALNILSHSLRFCN